MEQLTPIVTWIASILSTLIVTALTAQINSHSKRREQREEDERKERAEWRASIDRRLTDLEQKMDTQLDLSCSDTRSDIVHKCHRYLDDLGCASSEEKAALWAQHENYQLICDANGIENNFVAQMVARVMGLPEREI